MCNCMHNFHLLSLLLMHVTLLLVEVLNLLLMFLIYYIYTEHILLL